MSTSATACELSRKLGRLASDVLTRIDAVNRLSAMLFITSFEECDHSVVPLGFDERQVRTVPFKAFLWRSFDGLPTSRFIDPLAHFFIAASDAFQNRVEHDSANHLGGPTLATTMRANRNLLAI